MTTILISAGHSNTALGAIANGVVEATLATELRNTLAGHLTLAGFDVVKDGIGSENLPLSSAVKMIAGKSLAIEIHFNAVVDPSANGVECISLPKQKTVSQKLAATTALTLGLKLRGDKGWIDQSKSQHSKLAFVQSGGMILEVCFISNKSDLESYQKHRDILAQTLAETIKSLVV